MNAVTSLRYVASILSIALLGGAAAPAAADEIWGSEKSLLVKTKDGFQFFAADARVELPIAATNRIEAVYSLDQHSLVGGVAGDSPIHQALVSGIAGPSVSRRAGDGDELYLAFASASGLRELPPPPQRRPGVSRENAVAISSSTAGLTGIAWIEGDSPRRQSVMTAEWNGSEFSAPSELSAPGPGSQLALSGTTLGDDSTLLVWSRYDGSDDEIYWSRGKGDSWSAPQPVAADNAVPDIVPAVTAGPGGSALAAWSHYDGHDYRVVVARFSNGSWSEPETVGEAGSAFPTFEGTAILTGTATLLYESAQPHGWKVVELSPAGQSVRQAKVATATTSRPVVQGDKLRWSTETRALRWISLR